jgi:fucose permease
VVVVTTFSRFIATLLGLAVAACAWLPWTRSVDAWHLHLLSLVSPGTNEAVTLASSIGIAVCVSAAVIVLGAVFNSRTLVIIGGLLSVAFPTIWILSNAISPHDGGIPMTQIQFGAYGAAVLGFMTLILAAVARDTRVPTAR